jgi:signal transduction histidine kinase
MLEGSLEGIGVHVDPGAADVSIPSPAPKSLAEQRGSYRQDRFTGGRGRRCYGSSHRDRQAAGEETLPMKVVLRKPPRHHLHNGGSGGTASGAMAKGPIFQVDTHLFRELGELLVGRESTALAELVKNAYDADAKRVTIDAFRLEDLEQGTITVEDDGNGMTDEEFLKGFLMIASRGKEAADRRSPVYKRRYTGSKGIGRLAAHKLAKHLTVESRSRVTNQDILAKIDWELIEDAPTLDSIQQSAVTLNSNAHLKRKSHGTILRLGRIRREWRDADRARLFNELSGFQAPRSLISLERTWKKTTLLLPSVLSVHDALRDPGFHVDYKGDFEVGASWGDEELAHADWLLEWKAPLDHSTVDFKLTDLDSSHKAPGAVRRSFEIPAESTILAGFEARVFVFEGKSAPRSAAGIRVYMEGFRVLPYGDYGDDWLDLDRNYSARRNGLLPLKEFETIAGKPVMREALSILPNRSYVGGVFLKESQAPTLKMVANREGFVPSPALDQIGKILRTGLNLAVRVRASINREKNRVVDDENALGAPSGANPVSFAAAQAVEKARDLSDRANEFAKNIEKLKTSNTATTRRDMTRLHDSALSLRESAVSLREATEKTVSTLPQIFILASLGLQMSAFAHELGGLIGMAQNLETALAGVPRVPAALRDSLQALRRAVERQASFLFQFTSVDATRRKSAQRLDKAVTGVLAMFDEAMREKGVSASVAIPSSARTPPMFAAELTSALSNLVSNAIKAAQRDGHIAFSASADDEQLILRIENTGARVDLAEAERWFRPFESTTTNTDAVLGQGMGLGLPITRSLVERNSGSIKFVSPSKTFSSAVQIVFRR